MFNPKNGLYTVIEVIDTHGGTDWKNRVRRIQGAFGPNASVSTMKLDRGNKDAVFNRLGIGKRKGR
ncbi:MAG: hypothetical protein JNM07_07430 [Phycisphaerae bacterium]|nr:hypothetical protein [Phycisphaerae bacterium]